MSLTWRRLRRHLDRYDVDGVVALVSQASEWERQEVAAQLVAYVKEIPADRWQRGRRVEGEGPLRFEHLPSPVAGVAVAAVGVLPSAQQVSGLLCWEHVRRRWAFVPVPPFIEVARSRRVPWLGELATRLAASSGATEGYALVAALVTEAGIPPPVDAPFVRGWIETCLLSERADPSCGDAIARAMAPRLFELDGLGPALNMGARRQEFVAALVDLTERGTLDRGTLLDGCLTRFARCDLMTARPLIDLHDALSASTAELAARTGRYVAAVSGTVSTVVGLAQRALQTLDEAGELDAASLLQASEAILRRTEKGLARTQLRWLDHVAQRHACRAGAIVEAVAIAFAHPAADVQAQALAAVERHLAAVDPAGRQRLAAAASDLPADLRARAADLLGVAVAAPDPVAVPVDLVAAPMPAPIDSAAELADQIDALARDPAAVVAWERTLDGLVRVQAHDPHGIVDALAPVLDRHDHLRSRWPALGWSLFHLLGEAMRATGPRRRRAAAASRRNLRRGRVTHVRGFRGLWRVMAARVAEMRDLVATAAVPALVATPTSADGRLEPGALVERLAAAEAAGWQPGRYDLMQALLRMPRDVDPRVVVRAQRLRAPAGARLAGWLATGGLPDPRQTRIEQRRRRGALLGQHLPPRRIQVALRPAGTPPDELERIVCVLDPGRSIAHHCWSPSQLMWPAVAPHHREVVAAWALWEIAATADSAYATSTGPVLPLLAACGGPFGPAMTLAITYGLAAREEDDRSAAAQALLALDHAGDLDATGMGRELGGLCADRVLKLGRAVAALDQAARAGAHGAVCRVVCAALPAILATPSPPGDTPDLLALATDAAATVGWRATMPELDAVVDRGGASRLVTEARRLRAVFGR